MYNIIRAMLVPLCVTVLTLTSWCIVYAPDTVAAALGADADWLWPVVVGAAIMVVRVIPHHEQGHIDEPWEVMRCFTPEELYGDDHDVGAGGSGSYVQLGNGSVDRHVRGAGLAATPAIR